MYECAKKCYEENGHLEVPERYFSEDGYSLSHWIYNQRSIRKGQVVGALTDMQIEKLNKIGMRWDLYTDCSWNVNYNAAKEYYEKFGNLDVASGYVTKDGICLGGWLSNLRAWESSGAHPKYLTAERKKALEEIGMIWSKLNYYWENNFFCCMANIIHNTNPSHLVFCFEFFCDTLFDRHIFYKFINHFFCGCVDFFKICQPSSVKHFH